MATQWLFAVMLGLLAVGAFGQTTLTVTPTLVKTSGSNVTLTWAGLSDPKQADFIAIYSPSTSSTSDYIGWWNITESTTKDWRSGSGSITTKLVNNRADYIFRLFGSGGTKLVATSSVVTFQNPNEPLQGHLQLTDDPTEMRVMWVTNSSTYTPVVQYSSAPLSSGKATIYKAMGNSSTYFIQNMCDAPASDPVNFRDPGWIHDALMTGLKPATKYYYNFGNDNEGWSPEYTFVSSPGVGPNIEVELLVYGDLGQMPPFQTAEEQQPPAVDTVYWLNKEIQKKPNIPWSVIHVGDVSYARGYAYIWEWFFDLVQPVATAAPYMVCMGNHEFDFPGQSWNPTWSNYGTDSGGECGIPYMARFHMPGPQIDQSLNTSYVNPRNLWFSYEYGPFHFTFMSTENDFLAGSEQWNWLYDDLANVDRTKTPWLVFSGHRPMYSSNDPGSAANFTRVFQANVEPLLVEFDVDLCFWGHVHDYERTCGMVHYECAESDSDAPVHITIGNAGNDYQTQWFSPTNDLHQPQPKWSVYRSTNFGYGRLYANSTALHYEQVDNNRGEVHDQVWLYKN